MKYQEILQALKVFTPEQLDMDCTIYVPWDNEYFPVEDGFSFATDENDVLDENQPLFSLQWNSVKELNNE